MSTATTTACCLLLVLIPFVGWWHSTEAIVVDGTRKGPSARKHQSHEKEMIDVFNTKTCGISDPDHDKSDFVNAAKPGEFPWLVSLQLVPPCVVDKVSICMGSFISDTWVLTAAHCFARWHTIDCLRKGQLMAFAGTTNIHSPHNANFTIKRVFTHGLYNDSIKVGFDVALVELTSQASLRESYGQQEPFINTVCLPITGKEFKEGQAVKIAGWGKTEHGNDQSAPDNLLTTDLHLTNATKCAELFASQDKKEIKIQYDRYKDFICADYHGQRDACQGDSGGPMLEYADGKAVAIGIVSYGMGCATKGWPGVYERVSSLMPWIKDITQNKEKAKVHHTVTTNERHHHHHHHKS